MAESFDGNVYEYGLVKFRDENTSLVEVCLAANLPGWVELSSTRPV